MAPKAKALIATCALAVSLASVPAMAASDGFWIGPVSGGGGSYGGSKGGGSHGPAQVDVGKGTGYHYNTINEGIRAVGAGGVVRVQPGIYGESLKITKPVTVVGLVDKPNENLVKILAPADQPCAYVDTQGAGLVSLRQLDLVAGQQNVSRACVELQEGYLSIKDSSITSPSYVSAVLARGGQLSVETSKITGGREGILVASQDPSSTFNIVGNTLVRNTTGIRVEGLAQVNISANFITENSNEGVVYYQGRGNIVGNNILKNFGVGVVMQDGAQRPNLMHNRIEGNNGSGLRIVPATDQSNPYSTQPIPIFKGDICDNDILNNNGPGIESQVNGFVISSTCNKIAGNRGDKRRRGGLFGN